MRPSDAVLEHARATSSRSDRTVGWLEATEGGPFAEAARRFLEEHPGAPAGAARGAEGLRALAGAIDAWAEREESALDEGFVEGAGALLAMILLDHVGEGAHIARGDAHRVRLGRDGFFDPFLAIDRALESDDARAALAVYVGRAEAEAAGTAGVGRAMRLLRELLARERSERSIVGTFGAEVQLDEAITLDLTRVLRATEGEGEGAARRAVEKLVAMLPGGGGAATDWSEVRERLVPRVVAPGFAASVGKQSRLAFSHRVSGALEITLAIDYQDRSRYVRAAELEAWTLSFGDALAIAVTNLAARSVGARFARVDTPAGPLVMARTGDGLDAARLLLPTLFDVLVVELGDPFLAAVPHRDVLFACADDPTLRRALVERAQDDAARAPHRITDQLFRVSRTGLSLA